MKALPCLLLPLLAAILGSSPTAQDAAPPSVRLRVRHELPIDGKPLGLASLDLDGDGKPELCAITKSPGALHIFNGFERGLGTNSKPIVFPIGDYPVGPVVSNGEVVVGSRSRSELHWFNAKSLESGQPRLGIKLKTPPRALVSADLNSDGREEICVLTKENEILIASADGSVETTFTAHDQPCCAWPLSDGRLVIGFQVSNEVCVYRRDTAQKPGWSIDWQVKFEGVPRAIRELDFEGNGDLELVISGGDREHWVLGLDGENGVRDWTEPEEVKPKRIRWGAIPYAQDAARVGERDELFTMAYFEPAWGRFAGSPPARVDGGYAGQSPVAISAADFDGDGRIDLAVANSGARRISLMFGGEDGKLRVAPQVRTGRAPTEVCVADVDGDGKPEAITLNALDNTASVVRWGANGLELVASHHVGAEITGIACSALHHESLDSRPRLLITSRGPSGGRLEVPSGVGGALSSDQYSTYEIGASASDVLVLTTPPENAREEPLLTPASLVCVADPDGDRLHVLQENFAYVNADSQPHPELSLAYSMPLESGPLALAPLEGERVAVALGGSGERVGVAIVRVFGTPLELEHIPLAEKPLDICSGDFDGDGRLDIGVLAYEGNRDGNAVFIPLLTRDKGFIPGPKQRTGLRAHSIVSGDLNGDGLDDVLVSAQNSHHVNLWLSRKGSPVSFERQADLGLETGPLGLALADANGDGKLDIFVANAFANSLSLVLNESR